MPTVPRVTLVDGVRGVPMDTLVILWSLVAHAGNEKVCHIQMAVLPKVRTALCAVSQLPGEGPTDVEDAPAPAL